VPFLAFPAEIRKVIYTTNAIEGLHMQLRKVLKTAATSLTTKPPPITWKRAMTQFAILFADRLDDSTI